MSLSATPALNTDDIVALLKNTKLDGFGNSPLKAAVDVFLPVGLFEVGLLLGEEEGIDAAVKV